VFLLYGIGMPYEFSPLTRAGAMLGGTTLFALLDRFLGIRAYLSALAGAALLLVRVYILERWEQIPTGRAISGVAFLGIIDGYSLYKLRQGRTHSGTCREPGD
jgi:hypothetical protein